MRRVWNWLVATFLIFGGSTAADALDPKQCLPMAEINAALSADGQRTLILGNREALNDPTGHAADMTVTRYANAVTANADGSLGYQLEGDLPRAQASTRMCVRARLTHIRLFDAHKPGVPRDAMLGGVFSSSAIGLNAKGMRVMLVADTVHPDGHGGWSGGAPLVVFGHMEHRSGSLTTMNAEGPQLLAVMGDTEYTPEARRRLGLPEH